MTTGGAPVPVIYGGTGSSNASDARTALGLAIGTEVQAYSTTLSSAQLNGLPYANLGVSYNAGTGVFTIKGADGSALSASNPAFVWLQSKGTPGVVNKHTITANQDFIDDVGASEIIGNLFGFTTSVAITVDIPFFIYACIADDASTISFAISRVPHARQVCASGSIGTPGTANANTQGSFFFFETITAGNYDTNPCVNVGCVRMRMSASDDWTVQALGTTDGIGQDFSSTVFSIPPGQFGADSGTFCVANGGTCAVWTTGGGVYTLSVDGQCSYKMALSGDGGTDGSGAVNAIFISPFIPSGTTTIYFGAGILRAAGGNFENIACTPQASNQTFIYRSGISITGTLLWSVFTNGIRVIQYSSIYSIGLI